MRQTNVPCPLKFSYIFEILQAMAYIAFAVLIAIDSKHFHKEIIIAVCIISSLFILVNIRIIYLGCNFSFSTKAIQDRTYSHI